MELPANLLKLKFLKASLALATDAAGTGRLSTGADAALGCGAGDDLADGDGLAAALLGGCAVGAFLGIL